MQDNGFGIGRFAPLAVKIGKLFIGLPAVKHFRVTQPVVIFAAELFHLLTDSRKIGYGMCEDNRSHLSHSVFPPRQPVNIRGSIRHPHLRISRSGKYGHIRHHTGYTVLHMVQLYRFSRNVRRAEQTARHRSAQHGAWQSGIAVGLCKRLAAEKPEPEDRPKGIVRLHHVGSGLVARRQRHTYLFGQGNQRDRFRRGEILKALAPRTYRHAGVGRITVAPTLVLDGHGRHIQRTTAVHFRLTVHKPYLKSDDKHHNHTDGQCRTQYGNPRYDRILAQMI